MKNRTLGSIFIVAGTTIGAGMLAMPLAAAGVGFGVTLALLVSLWLLMCYTALLLVEVYQYEAADTGLGTLAKRYLGGHGQWLTGFSMMFLMYALTAAYISGAGELLATSISQWTQQSFPTYLAFTVYPSRRRSGLHRYPFGRFVQSYPVQCQNHFPDRNAGTDDAAYRKNQPTDIAARARASTLCDPGNFYVIRFPRQRTQHC